MEPAPKKAHPFEPTQFDPESEADASQKGQKCRIAFSSSESSGVEDKVELSADVAQEMVKIKFTKGQDIASEESDGSDSEEWLLPKDVSSTEKSESSPEAGQMIVYFRRARMRRCPPRAVETSEGPGPV